MLMEVKKHLKLMFICLKYNLIKAMDNRMSFVGQVIGMMMNNGIMILQWIVLFSIKDNIGGYDFKDVVLLWGLAASSYGVAHAFFNNSFMLSNLIMSGKLDAFLVQPKDTLIYVASSAMNISAIGDILYGFVLLIVLKANLLTWVLFTAFAVSGGIIIACFSMIFHSLTFWIKNSEEIANVLHSSMVSFATYPDGIFNEKIKWIFLTIIPVGFAVYIPISILRDFNLKLFIAIILVTIFIAFFAYFIFNKGLRKYSSSNLMSARI